MRPFRTPFPVHTRYVHTLSAVETKIEGRVEAQQIREMVDGFKTYDQGSGNWLVLAEKVDSYGANAIQEAVQLFGELHRERNLSKLFAVLTAPTVRMGASVVSMGLRASGSKLEIIVCSTFEEAVGALRDKRR